MPEHAGAYPLQDSAWASAELKNLALALVMEWGREWLQPIQPRLAEAAPDLDAHQRDALNALAQQAMHAGWSAMQKALRQNAGQSTLPDADAFRRGLGTALAWIDEERLSRLLSQSAYYALK